MVNEATGRLFKRKDGKYLCYLPVYLCEDSMFPFKDSWQQGKRQKAESEANSIPVKISFALNGEKKLIIEGID
ncbi:MAG: hypothetical protein OEY47_01305 [Candidatus Bathyarchaeota archaeon]|nr:hypothetical protein [Candidatus Bathyarchaeota archaeon]